LIEEAVARIRRAGDGGGIESEGILLVQEFAAQRFQLLPNFAGQCSRNDADSPAALEEGPKGFNASDHRRKIPRLHLHKDIGERSHNGIIGRRGRKR